MELTVDQRRRMEANRLRARSRLRERQLMQNPAGSGGNGGDAHSPPTKRGAGGGDGGCDAGATHASGSRGSRHTSRAADGRRAGNCSSGEEAKTGAEAGVEAEEAGAMGGGEGGEGTACERTHGMSAGRPATAASAAAIAVAGAHTTGSRAGGRGLRGTRAGGGDRGGGGTLSGGGGGDSSAEAAVVVGAAAACEGCGGAEGDARVDQELLQGFGLSVCRTCKLSREEYQCVTKKEAKEVYLLPEGTIAVLKFVERDNPHHASWTKMKLYLRRDVADYSFKRWGDESGLAAERSRREALRYDRSLARTKGVFKRARSETRNRDVESGFADEFD